MTLSRLELLNEFTYGWWECDRWQSPIIQQLSDGLAALKSVGSEPGSGGKPKSKPPMDLSDMDLIYDCLNEVKRVDDDEDAPLTKLARLRDRARLVLGYDVGTMMMPDMVCHVCHGPLIVARDASSAVECAEACGVSYPCETWLDLLAQRSNGEHSC